MQKTIILAIFTLGLAVATMATHLVRPYPGALDNAASAAAPSQGIAPATDRARLRAPVRGPVLQASSQPSVNAI